MLSGTRLGHCCAKRAGRADEGGSASAESKMDAPVVELSSR